MCSRLVLHTDYRIRLSVLTVLYDIYSQCSISLAPLIENVLIDCVVLLLNDPYESISMLSAKVRDHLMQSLSSNFMNRLRDRLYTLSNSIRNEVLAKGDVNGRLQQIHGVLLTLISGGGDIFPERKFSDQLAIAMASTLHLDCKRLLLSKQSAEIAGSGLELLDNLALAYGVKNNTVHQIATLLAKSDSPLMDCISAVVQRSESLDEQIGCYLFAAYLLRAADLENAIGICEKFFSTIGGMVDQAVSQLDRIDIHRKTRDDLIEDNE
ncbi:unnamed protein product [Gongylonema pulchrum]|uniref:RTP1_C1 domain-containing protein n=1 Tax=Gongylonema pulchrum TaxID=637853 RepID=A0A183EQC1_9BILA|nr:unnamed protein product [Gongylonema pulchrum]